MTCEDWQAFLHDYVLGDLGEPARRLLDRHTEECAGCLSEARALQVVDRSLAELPDRTVPGHVADRVLAALPVRTSWRGELARLAAAALLAACIAGALTVPDPVQAASDAARKIVSAFPSEPPSFLQGD